MEDTKAMEEYKIRFKNIMNRSEIRSKLLFASNDNSPMQNYILQKEGKNEERKRKDGKRTCRRGCSRN